MSVRSFYRKILKFTRRMNQSIEKYEKQYQMESYPSVPIVKIGLAVTGVLTVGVVGSWFFFRKHITNEGSRMAGEIASSQDVKRSLTLLLEDPAIAESSTQLINKLLANPEVQNSFVKLAVEFFGRREIEDKLAELIINTCNRSDVKETLNALVAETCEHEPNRDKMSEMIKSILSNPETKTGLFSLMNSMVWG